jgi:hypothetical protein
MSALYSVTLLEAVKCSQTMYSMCTPRGEMKTRPTPARSMIELSK